MKRINVLQLASFEGNIGDNANHNGTRLEFKKNLNFNLSFSNLEIRDFFYKRRYFNQELIDTINKYDLLMIGGGNYFELWVEKSRSGTSIDMDPNLFSKIDIPVLFYGLGVDPGQGYSDKTISKFQSFLDVILSSRKNLVSVRNDGSMEALKSLYGNKYLDSVHHIPDGGFFISVKNYYHPELPKNKFIIGINLAGDMINIRFNDKSQSITFEDFQNYFTYTMIHILKNPNIHLIFLPHIYKDLEFINKVINSLPDDLNRRRITIAPYLHGEGSEKYIFDIYKKVNLIIGMRFHANVCGIGLNTPTIGLVTYRQIQKLYEELNLKERMIISNQNDFSNELIDLIIKSEQNEEKIRLNYKKVNNALRYELKSFHIKMNDWLGEFF